MTRTTLTIAALLLCACPTEELDTPTSGPSDPAGKPGAEPPEPDPTKGTETGKPSV